MNAVYTTPSADIAAAGERGRTAEWPTQIPGRGWWDILRRMRHALARDHIWVAAAGVAFCTLFAAIPGATVILACFGLFADPGAVHRHLEMTVASCLEP